MSFKVFIASTTGVLLCVVATGCASEGPKPTDELTKAQRENASLRHQLDVLCQRLFGKKSERVDPRQLQLALEQLANEPGPVTEIMAQENPQAFPKEQLDQ